MHPSLHATSRPDRDAYVMASTGEAVSYAQLESRANQGAHLFRQLGLKSGDVVAFFLENHPRFMELVWAAERCGFYFVAISSRLTADELEYILQDSGARLLVTSTTMGPAPDQIARRLPELIRFSVGGQRPGYRDFETERAAFPSTPIADQRAGEDMLYSSGTTGRPKGVKRPPPPPELVRPELLTIRGQTLYGMGPETIYLCPAPLYHSAPLRWSMSVNRLGGTVVVMERFDAEAALALIERHRITHSQWVPTHFVRLLKLPEATRRRYDLRSLKVAFHAAAPCPIHVKEAMIEWWGPIIYEYYSGTEGAGTCAIGPEEWLTHKGSVGRAITAELRICGPDGEVLPPLVAGDIYFADGPDFEYHNDPAKTAKSRNRHGWRTYGDVGYVDEEGYLYLSDRKDFMIITGGVNVYPQEIENAFLEHAAVDDVAVFGAPDEELGERVVAVVQPQDWSTAGPELAAELSRFIRTRVSGVKAPKQIDFRAQLPREPTGKLFKRLLRDEYRNAPART